MINFIAPSKSDPIETKANNFWNQVLFLEALLLLPFICGLIWPTGWWGTHFLHFLPGASSFILLAAGITLLAFSWRKKSNNTLSSNQPTQLIPYWFVGLVGVFATSCFYHLQITNDVYGNARGFSEQLAQTLTELPADYWSNWLSFEFKPGNGRKGVRLLVEGISYYGQVPLSQAFRLLDALCGGLFIGLLAIAARKLITVRKWQLLFGLVALTSPLLLIFCGHIETYAPIYLLLLVNTLVFVKCLRSNALKHWILLGFLLLLGIRLHTLMYLLVPAFGVGFLSQRQVFHKYLTKLQPLKGTLVYLYLPALTLGICLYFFVFQDYNDPRRLVNFEDIDRLFLPLFSPAPPLDNYNLFSWNHVFDYLNMFLLWSPALLLVLGALIIAHRKIITWQRPEIRLIVLTILFFVTFLFAINPLFSMPMDWDLFMFPVPLLLVLTLLLIEQAQTTTSANQLLWKSSGFAVLAVPAFMVLLTSEPHSCRLENVGIHIYKTYYEHASTYQLLALNALPDQPYDVHQARQEQLIATLLPYATPDNDWQLANLYIDQGYNRYLVEKNAEAARSSFLQALNYAPLEPKHQQMLETINAALIQQRYQFPGNELNAAELLTKEALELMDAQTDFRKALLLFQKAHLYDPGNKANIIYQLEANFRLQDFEAATNQAELLLALKYPTQEKALRINIHVALEAQHFDRALQHCEALLTVNPADTFILTIQQRLIEKDRVSELRLLFTQ